MATTNPWDFSSQTNNNFQGGLISSAIPTAQTSSVPTTIGNTDKSSFNAINPPAASPAGYQPTQRTVDPTKETTAGQFNELIKQDNPFIQMARTNAKQQANAKGLLNSSMAISAADAAAYQAALPIAQSDAQIHNTAAQQNQAYQNEALKANTSSINDITKANLTAWTDTAKANMDASTKTQLASIEADYKTVMQNSASASEMYKQTVKNLSDIMANKDLTVSAKNQAVDNQLYMLKQGFLISGAIGNMNLGDLLNFSAAPKAA